MESDTEDTAKYDLIKLVNGFYNLARVIRGTNERDEKFYGFVGFTKKNGRVETKPYKLDNIDPDKCIEYLAYLIGIHEIDWALLIADMEVAKATSSDITLGSKSFKEKANEELVGLLFDRLGAQLKLSSSVDSCFKLADSFDLLRIDAMEIIKDLGAFVKKYKDNPEVGWVVSPLNNNACSNMPNFDKFSIMVAKAEDSISRVQGVLEWNDWS